MVRLTVALRAATRRDAEALLDTFRYLMASTRIEPGCQKCSVWADADFTVHYEEGWDREADVRRRVSSPEFLSLLSLMECACAPPEVQFDFVTETRGLDFVAEVRADSEREQAGSDAVECLNS